MWFFTNMNTDFLISLITAGFIGAVAGYVGSLMATKKMSLVGDVLSHVALPGIGLGLIYGVNISLGALASLSFGILLIWWLGIKTELTLESLVGVVFVLSLAVGFFVTPEEELLHALFGDISAVNIYDAIAAIFVSVIVFLAAKKIYPKMMLAYVSEDLALAGGINVKKYNLIYLFLIAATVAFGIKLGGSLLTSALIIIPAAASRNVVRSMFGYSYLSMAIGALISVAGVFLSVYAKWPAGPAIILLAVFVFGATLFAKRAKAR